MCFINELGRDWRMGLDGKEMERVEYALKDLRKREVNV